MYLVCTRYVPGTNLYIHGKTEKSICITLGIKQWISCTASWVLYHYTTWWLPAYIPGDIWDEYKAYTHWNLHLHSTVHSGWCQTSCAGPAAPQAPAMTSLVSTSTWISRMPMLALQETDLERASWLWNTTDCCPSSNSDWAALSDSESASQGSGAARLLFRVTGIQDHDHLFGCTCKHEWTVEPPAGTGGRQIGKKTQKRKGKLGWSRTWAELEIQVWNFPRFKLVLFLIGNPQSPLLKIMWVPVFVVIQYVL